MPSQCLLDHAGELFVRGEALPLQLLLPVVEERAGIRGIGIAPELLELFAQQVSDVQACVGLQQAFEVLASAVAEVLSAGEQNILLSLDEIAFIARDTLVFRPADVIERIR